MTSILPSRERDSHSIVYISSDPCHESVAYVMACVQEASHQSNANLDAEIIDQPWTWKSISITCKLYRYIFKYMPVSIIIPALEE